MKKLLLVVMLMYLSCGSVWAATPDIAVAVVHGQFAAEISCEDEIVVRVPDTGEEKILKPDRYFVNAEGGIVNIGTQKIAGRVLLFTVNKSAKNLEKYIEVNKKSYRGSFEVCIDEDGKTLNVVNIIPLEEYLYSVVGGEIPVIFPDEAIKAQAVAARSLAYNRLGNRNSLGYDLKAAEEGQEYYGVVAEKSAINKLVDNTYGVVITYNGQVIEAVYHQSSGGQTENSGAVWGRNVPYLQSVKDYDWDAPVYDWEKALPAAEIERRLSASGYVIGKLESMRLSPWKDSSKIFGGDRTVSGRVQKMLFSGSEGTVMLAGTQVQKLLGLNSNLFEVKVNRPVPDSIEIPIENYYGIEIGRKEVPIKVNESSTVSFKDILKELHFVSGENGEMVTFIGRGQGSGLGLSQWGARGMANSAPQRSKDYYKEILAHYYVDTRVEKIY